MNRVPLLDLAREHAAIAAELRREWDAVLETMHLLGGAQLQAFEREMAAYLGAEVVYGVASGTDALLLGLEALGIGRGDRVALAANAFVAALEALYHLGATPVLVDCLPDSFAPDFAPVLDGVRAVIVVHLYGSVVALGADLGQARDRGLLVVEDASHAHGAERGGRKAGTFGDAGCFSAGVVKNLAAYGDAGFVAAADRAVGERLRLLRVHGQERKNHHVLYGHNSRLDELQAAVLRVKLRHLERRNERRRQIAAYYGERLGGLPLRLPAVAAGERPAFHQYVVRSERRGELQAHLQQQGIETGIHYPVPLHRQPAWLRAYGEAPPLPHAEKLAREILSLPVFPELSDAEVERVAAAVRSFFC